MSYDYDLLIVGSGFGGSIAALRAAEQGYRVGESARAPEVQAAISAAMKR